MSQSTETVKTPKLVKLSSSQFTAIATEFQTTSDEQRAAELKNTLVEHLLHLND